MMLDSNSGPFDSDGEDLYWCCIVFILFIGLWILIYFL